MYKRRAFSLIEVALVICLAATIILLAARQYTKYTQTKDIATLNNSVQLLLDGMQAYLEENCTGYLQDFVRGGGLPAPQIITLACLEGKAPCTQAYVNAKQIQNPFNPSAGPQGADSFYMMISPNQVPFQVSVMVYFAKTMPRLQFLYIEGLLNPSQVNNSQVPYSMVWTVTTNFSTSYTGQDMDTLNASLQMALVNQLNTEVTYASSSPAFPTKGTVPCSAVQYYIYRKLHPNP